MITNHRLAFRISLLVSLILALTLASTRRHADTGTCGGETITLPFTDVMSSPFFCQIAEAFFSGLANGTSATTYNPSGTVTRDQMAAFITRAQDSALRRGDRRAAIDQWWTPLNENSLQMFSENPFNSPTMIKSSGPFLWMANPGSAQVFPIEGERGIAQGNFDGATNAFGVAVTNIGIFVTGSTSPLGSLYMI